MIKKTPDVSFCSLCNDNVKVAYRKVVNNAHRVIEHQYWCTTHGWMVKVDFFKFKDA